MELADRTLESTLDMTAADTAPSPINDTHVGVRYCKTSGIIIEDFTSGSPLGRKLFATLAYWVCFQSKKHSLHIPQVDISPNIFLF